MFEDFLRRNKKFPELKASDIILPDYVKMTIRFSEALQQDPDGVCYVYKGYGVEAEQLWRIETHTKKQVTILVPADQMLWIAAIGMNIAMWVGGKFIAKKDHINDIWLQANYEDCYRGY